MRRLRLETLVSLLGRSRMSPGLRRVEVHGIRAMDYVDGSKIASCSLAISELIGCC